MTNALCPLVLAASAALAGCGSSGPLAGPRGDPGLPTPAVCPAAAAPGRAGAVQAPVLRATLAGSWDENWFASPALVDLDADGRLDIVAARHSVLYAWRHDGTPLWKTAFGHAAGRSPEHGDRRMWASPVAGDLDGDGQVEIAVASAPGASPDANLALYDARGGLRAGWPRKFGTTEVRGIAAADVDGDGRRELLVNKTASGPVTAVLGLDGAMRPGWPQVSDGCSPAPPTPPCFDYGGYNQNIGAADLDGDGAAEVVSTYDAIGFGLFRGDGTPLPAAAGFRDTVVTGVEAYHELALAQQGWGDGDRTEFTDSPPAVGDIDGDGRLELVLVGNHEHTRSTESQGDTLWVLRPDASRPPGWERPRDTGAPVRTDDPGHNIVLTLPGPAVAELDGRPGQEVLFPGQDGRLHAFRSDGTPLWDFTFGSARPYVGASEPLVVDLNGDGAPEVLFTTYSSGAPREPEAPAHLFVLASNGTLLHQVALSGRGAMAAPSVGDLEGDGSLELVVSLKDSLGGALGGVQVWSLPGSSPGCVLWGTGRGSLLRTGEAAPVRAR